MWSLVNSGSSRVRLGLINVDLWNYLTIPLEVVSSAARVLQTGTACFRLELVDRGTTLSWPGSSYYTPSISASFSLSLVYVAVPFLLYSSNFSLLSSYLITSHLYSPRIMVPPFSFVLFAIAFGIVTLTPFSDSIFHSFPCSSSPLQPFLQNRFPKPRH